MIAATGIAVLTVGETMALVVPEPLEALETSRTAQISIAGAESTVSVYLSQLGHVTSWVSAVGDDPFGRRILRELRAAGVDTSYVRVDADAQTGAFFKDPQPDGTTSVRYYRRGSAASRLSTSDLGQLPMHDVRIVHVTGITPALSVSCSAVIDQLVGQPRKGDYLLSFDVNYRPALWTRAAAPERLLQIALQADLVFTGLDEARRLWHADTPRDVRRLLPRAQRLVVKDAAVGAWSFGAGDDDAVFAPSMVANVVEPVGAGDAFAAGYLHGLLTGLDDRDRLDVAHKLAGASLAVTTDTGALPRDLIPHRVPSQA